ncbi:ribonuclease H-like protein [Dentipellis sp. KUC8613]|nr:ribonuclease H-like protein [Dentipellis sp. KUC8613]
MTAPPPVKWDQFKGEVPPNAPIYDWRQFFPDAQLKYIRTPGAADAELSRLIDLHPMPIVGFDLEWRPGYFKEKGENPVAVVQLAFEETILLIQISAMQDFPRVLHEFLENPYSTKVGVGIQYDCKKLFKDRGVSVRRCVDLALLARSVDSRWKGKYGNSIGLARLSEIYLARTLPKGPVRMSNWEAHLNDAQLNYAANDCQSSLMVYYKLFARAVSSNPIPEEEFYTFDAIRGVLRDPFGRPWFPFNPFYDPGPPPPRPPKVSDVVVVDELVETSIVVT